MFVLQQFLLQHDLAVFGSAVATVDFYAAVKPASFDSFPLSDARFSPRPSSPPFAPRSFSS